MNKELTLWQHALAALGCGERCMLLLVVESIGSSPGRAGFKALVTSGGELHGSIGGGSMEHKLVELARAVLASGSRGNLRKATVAESGDPEGAIAGVSAGSSSSDPAATPSSSSDPAATPSSSSDPAATPSSSSDPAATPSSSSDPAATPNPFLKRQVHRADEPADRSGMICSGEQSVAFYPLAKEHVPLLKQLIAAYQSGGKQALQCTEVGLSLHTSTGHSKQFMRRTSTQWSYTEPLDEKPRIIILGAGHVGLALSRTMEQLGFHVHQMDDRAGLNTMAMNQWAHERSVVDYRQIGDVITDDPELYIVLVSFGYRTDALLARQLLRKKFKYLGMMGSTGKIEKLLADMRADGFTEGELARLRTPIGLPIHSKTPEEIAVSIAAEIIGVKNGA